VGQWSFPDFAHLGETHVAVMAVIPQDLPSYPVDRPLRLAVAASIAFPDGSMTASGLRREAQRGRLVIERIAGKDYTTLAAIEKMRELCRVEAKGHGSGCAKPSMTELAGSRTRPSGSSKTANTERARDAALMIPLVALSVVGGKPVVAIMMEG